MGKKFLIMLSLLALLGMQTVAQGLEGGTYTITVSEPGELANGSYSITGSESKLVVEGPVNGADISALNMIVRSNSSIKELNLTNASVEGSVIPENAFSEYYETIYGESQCVLESIMLPDGVREIGQFAFENLPYLREIKLPADLEVIGAYCFANCTSLETIELPGGVEHLPLRCFSNCSSLKTVLFPGSLKRIGAYAFEGAGVEEITLPEGLQRIDRYAFKSAKLKKLSILSTDIDIKAGTFENNTELTDVELPSTLKKIPEYMFKSCTALRELKIPEGVEVVDYEAFYGCSSLCELSLPATLRFVSVRAFYGLCTETIVIPENVRQIGLKAFYSVNPVSKIYMKCPNSPILFGSNVIGEWGLENFCMNVADENVPIYIPKGSYSNYSDGVPWAQFKNYIEIEVNEFP